MRAPTELSKQIIAILRIATAPLTATDIRDLVKKGYDADCDSSDIAAHITVLIRNKKVQRHHIASGVLRYSLIGSKAATTPAEDEPAKPAAKGKLEAAHRPGDVEIKAFEDAVRRGRVVGPCGLKDRLAAIAGDLNDAVSDACDLKIEHEVIKALLASQAACTAALQRL